jgi:antitoxin component YwqK of YwqJK toxin-antitoxin module
MNFKNFLLILVSICLLNGCHSGTTQNNQGTNAIQSATDTSQMHIAPQPKDTTIKDGQVTKRYPNGVIKERSYYKDGRRHGECMSFYQNGKVCSDDYFTDGLIDGGSTVYYENGQKKYEGTFVKGKPAGTWSFYDEKGKLTRTINYGSKNNPI